MDRKRNISILDLGCGPKIRFYHYALLRGLVIKQYVAIDPLLDTRIRRKYKKSTIVHLIKRTVAAYVTRWVKKGTGQRFDYIVGFAFIEHIRHPETMMNTCIKLLKKGGKCIFTTPTPLSKLPLEFFAKIGLISEREIHEHKQYFDKKSLKNLIDRKARKDIKISHEYFELYFNNLFVIERLKTR